MERLSRREREIMDVIYRLKKATIREVQNELQDPPTDSAIRATLRILERKGHVRSRGVGKRNVYGPANSRERVARAAVRHLVATFFAGSRERALAAILATGDSKLTNDELQRLSDQIESARAKLES